MEIQGKIIAVLAQRNGVTARGEWKAQSFVIETHENYPKKIVFDVFGDDKLTQYAIKVGDELQVSIDIDAHEYQGRWFNSIRAWNVQRIGGQQPQYQPAQPQQVVAQPQPVAQAQPQPQPYQPQNFYQQPQPQATPQAQFPPQQPQQGVQQENNLPF